MKKLALAALLLIPFAAQAGDHVIASKVPACQSQELFTKMSAASAAGDKEAMKKYLLISSASDNCVVFNAGESVYLTDTDWHGYAKIRREGYVTEYWTDASAVK